MAMRAVQATIRLYDTPSQCVGCGVGPETGMSYVEFILPALKDQLVGEGSTFVADDVDDLVLCRTCIRTAALRLGLRRDPRLDVELQRLTAARDATRALVNEALQQQIELRERIGVEAPR